MMVKMMFWLAGLAAAMMGTEGQVCKFDKPVDLGRVLDNNSYYSDLAFSPGNPITKMHEGNNTEISRNFCVGEHTGTHMDAPLHSLIKGAPVDKIPVTKLVTNGTLLNLSTEVNGNPSFVLNEKHIDTWITKNGVFPENAFLIIDYGWSKRYHDPILFLGTATKTPQQYKYPGMSAEAAKKLAEIKQLAGVGVDTLYFDIPGKFDAHVALAKKDKYIVESLDLEKQCLPDKGFQVVTLPVNVKDGTGAPTRIIALPLKP